jgi:hypothetical protein
MAPRKSPAERALIDLRTRLRAGTGSRKSRVDAVRAYATEHLGADIPADLLDALGAGEWSRGFTAGVKDATGDDT